MKKIIGHSCLIKGSITEYILLSFFLMSESSDTSGTKSADKNINCWNSLSQKYISTAYYDCQENCNSYESVDIFAKFLGFIEKINVDRGSER